MDAGALGGGRRRSCPTGWVRRFILLHCKRHPREMGEVEINAFLTHLAVERAVSASTQNQALNALLFLYRRVLERDLGDLGDIVRAKRKRKLPVVLTPEEVSRVLDHLAGVPKTVATLLHGSGLRQPSPAEADSLPTSVALLAPLKTAG